MTNIKKKLFWLWENFEVCIGVGSLAVVLFVLTYQVIMRRVFSSPVIWAEEVSRYLFIAASYFGASACVYYKQHVKIDSALYIYPKSWRPYVYILGILVWLILSSYAAVNFVQFIITLYTMGRNSSAAHIMMWIPYSAVALGFVFMSIRLVFCELIPSIKAVINKPSKNGEITLPGTGENNSDGGDA